jgi:sugar phosphate isomerase/epimerase
MRRERPDGGKPLALTDLPRFTRDQLNLFGLNIATAMLVGADFERLDALREAADKASCPCLVLVESEPQPFADPEDDVGDAAVDRMVRVAKAAHRLGCNAAAVAVSGPDDEDSMAYAAERLKQALQTADRLEINLLLMSHPGLTAKPDRVTDLIKKVGGFRIGTFPDFQTASKAEDPSYFLRRLTPYAAGVTASSVGFKESKKEGVVHDSYDLGEYAKVVASVGYTGTLAIDYRGKGDPAEGIEHTRTMLEAAVGPEAAKE